MARMHPVRRSKYGSELRTCATPRTGCPVRTSEPSVHLRPGQAPRPSPSPGPGRQRVTAVIDHQVGEKMPATNAAPRRMLIVMVGFGSVGGGHDIVK